MAFKTMRNNINHWWLILVAGILLLGVGAWVIKSPFQSYLSLSWVFAIGLVGTGIFEIGFALINHHNLRGWVWRLIAGIFDIIIGVYLFNNTLITIAFLPLIISLWAIFRGLTAVGDAFHIRAYGLGDWRRLLFTAFIIIAMAALILACPSIGIENIFLYSGFAIMAAGAFRIYLAFKLRKIKQIYQELFD
ncbi:DUF308 domain-containing protein [Mucilaginibacter sp. BJC16-A38]|uniref:HdeD family acid-resistance protein n=1 Tax=Mucilaginibacter phenanthrenivorans TaxID=1234842 RepID=UPI002157A3CC|nr:DUF308 domain-containing protein [Mucilaginibacter phenanthrenivorans]MCR8560787.1 DUF308 domain-containing protein [Mucilaginibacter phenanthrenivorans]